MTKYSNVNHNQAPTDESPDESLSFGEDHDMGQIIFKDVDKEGKYAHGKLGDFDVMIMKSNGYINATKICRDGGKHYKYWNENKQSKKISQELSKTMNIAVVANKKHQKLMAFMLKYVLSWTNNTFLIIFVLFYIFNNVLARGSESLQILLLFQYFRYAI
jgi:hypothetical protein